MYWKTGMWTKFSKTIYNNIYTLLKERLGEHEPEVEEPRSREEIVPDFLSLKVSLDTNDLQAFVYDFLTNQKETTFEALTKANQKLYRSRYKKQKKP